MNLYSLMAFDEPSFLRDKAPYTREGAAIVRNKLNALGKESFFEVEHWVESFLKMRF
jgi:hypothetical protein